MPTGTGPGPADWLITLPAGTVSLHSVLIVPTEIPSTAPIAASASACGIPTTGGTTGCPAETTKFTAVPHGAGPANGLWLNTVPEGSSLNSSVIVPTERFSTASIALIASAWLIPTTLGTTGCPLDTTRFTTVPGVTAVPPTGSWLRTVPAATVSLHSSVCDPTVSPAPVISPSASPWLSPTTLGTSIFHRTYISSLFHPAATTSLVSANLPSTYTKQISPLCIAFGSTSSNVIFKVYVSCTASDIENWAAFSATKLCSVPTILTTSILRW